MGGPGSRPTAVLTAIVLLAALVLPTLSVDIPAVHAAKKDKAVVACPQKVGKLKLDRVWVSDGGDTQSCIYEDRLGYVGLELNIDWAPDVQGERYPCETREPGPAGPGEDGWWRLGSASANVSASAGRFQGSASTKQVVKALRKAVAAAEPIGHPCVPPVEPKASDGLACPLLLPSGLVRGDWYAKEPYAIESMDDIIRGRYSLKCHYKPPYKDERPSDLVGSPLVVTVKWNEGQTRSTLCLAGVDEGGGQTETRHGYHPVSVEISDELVDRWGGQALADGLAAAAAARTQRCSDGPDGPAPYEDVATAASTIVGDTTDIVLSGGPGEELPGLDTVIELPAHDQHAIVIGGPDGEIIREESIGSHGRVAGFGPIVTDADGNWSVLVSVGLTAPPTPSPALTPAPTLEPSEEPTPEPTPARTPDPIPTPAPTPSPAPPTAPAPTAEPTLWPEREEIPGLGPEAQAAVDNVADSVEILGEILEDKGAGEVTIPAVDIELLIALAPDLAKSVKLGSGSIIVTIGRLDIHVTPDIGKDGLIEVKLSSSAYDWVKSTEIVQGLTRALNAGVAKRDGRFRTVQVTPEGITLTAEGPAVPQAARD